MSNRMGEPAAIKSTKGKKEFSSRVFWAESEEDIVLSSYMVRASKGKKNVLLLLTVQPLTGVTKNDGQKEPTIYKLYDVTKTGTDVVDQRMSMYKFNFNSLK